MFGKSKVSQNMIDAVNSVLEVKVEEKNITQPSDNQRVPMAPAGTPVNLSETAAIKEPTKTGMKVYGGSYGNSAKAKQDQTKNDIDKLAGPKDKEMKEELKGNQDKIDANHNDKIDAQDFKILKDKKKVKEDMHFAAKLLEVVRKSDVPAYLRKAKGDTPLTVADVKAPKKDTISAPENLAKARNEEVEHLDEDNLDSIAKKHGMEFKRATYGAGMKHPTKGEVSINRYGEWNHYPAGSRHSKAHGDSSFNFKDLDKHLSSLKEEVELDQEINEVLSKDASAGDWIHDFVHSDNPKFAGKSKAERKKMALGAYYGAQKESYLPADTAITTDTLAGRLPGGKANSFKSYKLRVKPLAKETGENETVEIKKPEQTAARTSIKTEEFEGLDEAVSRKDFQMVADLIKTHDNPGKRKELAQHHAEIFSKQNPRFDHVKFMKAAGVNEATIAGTPGWEKVEKNVKDKSGAVHTPMSRAKDLARQAFKQIQSKTKVK